MKETKRQLRLFSFFDFDSLQSNFEKMAAEGWMLTKVTNGFYHYRRIEPQRLKFTVTYFPQASDFDPYMTQEQETFNEFCAAEGWQFVGSWGQMQVYCNARENPVPIETDPVVQIETIHKAMKKNFLPSNIAILILTVLVVGMHIARVVSNPVAALSDNSQLFSTAIYIMLFFITAQELFRYDRWRKKAIKQVENGQPLTSGKSNIVLQLVVVAITFIIASIYVCWQAGQIKAGFMIVMYAIMGGAMLATFATKAVLKKLKAPRELNIAMTFIMAFVYTFAAVFGVTFYVIKNDISIRTDESQPVDTYEWHGIEWEVYNDELPLNLEDILSAEEIAYDQYSRRYSQSKSLLLSTFKAEQTTRAGYNGDAPELEYEIVKIHADFIYDWCFERLFDDMDTPYGDEIPAQIQGQLIEQGSAPWKANKAYRMLYEGQWLNRYLICWDDKIVELKMDFEPDERQMRIIAEKLMNT